MKKIFIGLFLGPLLLSTLSAKGSDAPPLGFFEGPYVVIGTRVNGGGPYEGTLTVRQKGKKLDIERKIEGRVIRAVGEIIRITPDRIPVIQIRFDDKGEACEGLFHIGIDNGNYARLTGSLFYPKKPDVSAGLEAWFFDHSPK